jgi:hypothetical protein
VSSITPSPFESKVLKISRMRTAYV